MLDPPSHVGHRFTLRLVQKGEKPRDGSTHGQVGDGQVISSEVRRLGKCFVENPDNLPRERLLADSQPLRLGLCILGAHSVHAPLLYFCLSGAVSTDQLWKQLDENCTGAFDHAGSRLQRRDRGSTGSHRDGRGCHGNRPSQPTEHHIGRPDRKRPRSLRGKPPPDHRPRTASCSGRCGSGSGSGSGGSQCGGLDRLIGAAAFAGSPCPVGLFRPNAQVFECASVHGTMFACSESGKGISGCMPSEEAVAVTLRTCLTYSGQCPLLYNCFDDTCVVSNKTGSGSLLKDCQQTCLSPTGLYLCVGGDCVASFIRGRGLPLDMCKKTCSGVIGMSNGIELVQSQQ
mmetsp:Transcript_12965/g.33183  ORF Transcript_12965/g.33183 Transcript_12965/m.33183 type:complete len:343 (-) Transcript_12965:231-1259(-)